jgi:hypothetical protein
VDDHDGRSRPTVDGERILAEAHELAIPRYPGTSGDARIIEILSERFTTLGLETAVEDFSYDIRPAVWTLRGVLITGGLLVAAAGWTAPEAPRLALLLLGVALLPGIVFVAWAPWLERLYQRPGPTRTANVVGRRPARDWRITLMVMAHHDSKSQSLTLPYRAGCTIAAILGSLALAALVVAGAITGVVPGPSWLAPAAGAMAAAAALVLSTMRSGNRSPGGVDNGGSMAILLELARTLPGLVADDAELVFLSPGAEEDHMVGAMRWLDSHAEHYRSRPVFCLNMDGAGSPGRLVLLERYGFGTMFSRRMSEAARRAAARLGVRVRGILQPPAMGIDAIPFAHAGIPCLTLSSGSLGRATASVHSARDVADNLDAATLKAATELGRDTLLNLAGM